MDLPRPQRPLGRASACISCWWGAGVRRVVVTDGVDMRDHQTTPAPEPATPNYSTTQADSDKGQGKAIRPWFKRKRFVLPLSFMLLIVILVAVNATGKRGSSISSAGGSREK